MRKATGQVHAEVDFTEPRGRGGKTGRARGVTMGFRGKVGVLQHPTPNPASEPGFS